MLIKFWSNVGNIQLGVRQGECLSPFLFSMYVNDLESHLAGQGAGVSIFDVKFLLLLYADDVVIFSDTPKACNPKLISYLYTVRDGN